MMIQIKQFIQVAKTIIKPVLCLIFLLAFSSYLHIQDADSDGVLDVDDNCVNTANSNQRDSDSKVLGKNVALGKSVSGLAYPSSDFIEDNEVNERHLRHEV